MKSIEIEGLERTDRSIMRQYFAEAMLCTTLKDLKEALREASIKCDQLQIFKGMQIDVEPVDHGELFQTVPRPLKIKVAVQERKAKFFIGSEWLSSNDLVGVEYFLSIFGLYFKFIRKRLVASIIFLVAVKKSKAIYYLGWKHLVHSRCISPSPLLKRRGIFGNFHFTKIYINY